MKKLFTILVALTLTLGLAACQSQDYEKAMELYESGDYSAAETVFLALGEYEDSAEMVRKCRYGRACRLYEERNYAEALPIFQDLGEYLDCKGFVNNCNYALAEAALAAKEYGKAADLYERLGDFKDCAQKETQARYFQLYQYVLDQGEEVDGGRVVRTEYTAGGKTYTIGILANAAVPEMLQLQACNSSTAVAHFTYNVYLAIPYGQSEGRVEAESLMTLNFGGSVSTSAETFRGAVVLGECTTQTQIRLEDYTKYERDASGKQTQLADVSKAPTTELHTHFYNLIGGTAALLEKLDLGVQLQDLGLTAWNG